MLLVAVLPAGPAIIGVRVAIGVMVELRLWSGVGLGKMPTNTYSPCTYHPMVRASYRVRVITRVLRRRGLVTVGEGDL